MKLTKIAVRAATYGIDKPYLYAVPEGMDVQPGMRVIVPFGAGNRQSEGLVLSCETGEGDPGVKALVHVLDEQAVLSEEGLKIAFFLRERGFSTLYEAMQTMLPTGLFYSISDYYSLREELPFAAALEKVGRSAAAKRLLEFLKAEGGGAEFTKLLPILSLKQPRPLLRSLVEAGILCVEAGAKRRVQDKTELMVCLDMEPEAALALSLKTAKKAPVRHRVTELLTGIGSASLREVKYFTGATRSTVQSLVRLGIVRLEEEASYRMHPMPRKIRSDDLVLSAAQESVYRALLTQAHSAEAEAALLYGVTGSGKTAVYLALIRKLLAEGKSSLVLVPEIALTSRLLEEFVGQFGDQVAMLHSALPPGERLDAWRRVRDGKAKVVLGTRSAVFAPLTNIGLIVLDEEQESSYQSDSNVRYHARDVAKFRCVQHGALLLLGSATPSLESMYAAKEGQYTLLTLEERFNAKALPRVVIADMKEELRQGYGGPIGRVLRRELEQNFDRGEQSILFLNRRGTHRLATCGECDYVPSCKACSVSLTYHAANGRLMCHHCGYGCDLPKVCPDCGGMLHFVGHGTQHVTAELARLYPGLEVLRMDADQLAGRHSHESILHQFRDKNIPVLVGTQMVAKGLDFENVTLVGVLSADTSLYAGSYRATERSFSLITQVVGRAGRGSREGRAVIQTLTPDHEVILQAARQDYDEFYEGEIALRRLQNLPPFGDLFRLTVSGEDEGAVRGLALRLTEACFAYYPKRSDGALRIIGPAPAAILKVKHRFRYQITIKEDDLRPFRLFLAEVIRQHTRDRKNRGMAVYVERNPAD